MLMMPESTNSYEMYIDQLERRERVEEKLLLEKQQKAVEKREAAQAHKAKPKPDRVNADVNRNRTAVIPRNKHTNNHNSKPALTVEATAYVADCEGCTGITKTGVDVRDTIQHEGRRVVAVDPSVIPLGSDVTLTFKDGSTMKATAEDVGGAIEGREIDILVDSRSKAIDFGRQPVQITIN